MGSGIDQDAATAWLADRVDGIEPPLTFSVIAGGKSNLTYRVTDTEGQRWVLRRPPLHGVIPSAHDMEREHRILSCLQETKVPVPTTIGYEPDPAHLGAPFYVMKFVDGHVLRDPEHAARVLEEKARAQVGDSMVDVLGALHASSPEAAGLGDLGRKEEYIARQLRAWGRQLGGDDRTASDRLRLLMDVEHRLSRSIPPQQQVAIVHGDYRLDNVIVSDDGHVSAVLDWELCTLGDPLADVAALAVYWSDPEDDFFPLESATVAPGFPRRKDILDWYMRRSSLDFGRFDYYLAFASWRLAVILEGVLRRFDAGAYGEDVEGDWERLRDVVPRLGETASAFLHSDLTALSR